MKQNNQMIESRLKRAVDAAVPNILPELLLNIEKKEVLKMNDDHTREEVATKEKKTNPRRWFRTVAPIAAALVLVFGVWFGTANYRTDAVVAFDVNPSIELSVNRAEKVLKVNSQNQDAYEVVGSMDLKGVDLDVAVNALIGSMVQKGYISEMNNSILITVNSNDAEKDEQLQERLSANISSLLKGLSIDGAILTQSAHGSDDDLAEKYGITSGKATLIEQIAGQDPTLEYQDLVGLSINDLNLLIESRQIEQVRVKTSGQASEKDYIGIEQAKEIALAHAKVAMTDVRKMEIEFDSDKGHMIYEIEFYANGFEYEYEIDAKNGRILEFEKDNDDDYKKPEASIPAPSQETSRETSRAHTSTTQQAATTTTKAATSERLSAAGARSLVLNNFGGMIEKIEYSYNESEPLYKGEAVKPGSRVVFELNAITHRFKKWDVSNDNDWNKWAHAVPHMITMDQAAKSVISKSGQDNTFVQKIEFNWDNEEPLYQGEAFYRGHKISFEIKAYGGGFYKWDLDGGDETWAEKYYNV
ncbi:MAG: hypothetical protein GX777_06020, partial [Fastidiosipila sp.]|nr:hypothetical protein [Fastidiosipila sp.]